LKKKEGEETVFFFFSFLGKKDIISDTIPESMTKVNHRSVEEEKEDNDDDTICGFQNMDVSYHFERGTVSLRSPESQESRCRSNCTLLFPPSSPLLLASCQRCCRSKKQKLLNSIDFAYRQCVRSHHSHHHPHPSSPLSYDPRDRATCCKFHAGTNDLAYLYCISPSFSFPVHK